MKILCRNFFLSLFAGGLYALAYPNFLGGGWFPLIFIALPIFLWQLEHSTFKNSLIIIFAFNLGLNYFGYYWIPHTLREFGNLPHFLSFILGTLTALVLQPHWWAFSVWKKYRPQWDWSLEKNILLTAFILTLLEKVIPQQFPSYVGSPWLHLAPYLGLAPYFGVIIFSFITYWISLEVIAQLRIKKIRYQPWMVLVSFILLNTLFPLKKPDPSLTLPIRIVQANIGNFLKVSSEKGDQNSFETIIRSYEKLSLADESFSPQLIIWPETAYPHTFYGEESSLGSRLKSIMDETNSELLTGGYDQDLSKSPWDFIETVYNSSLLLSEGKVKSIYHKNILIPFGETLPFGPFNRQIVSFIPSISLFAAGQESALMETKSGLRFVTPICYEILETQYMRKMLNQWGYNHFIVNLTNDSWYGETAEPFQHLFLSKWRALEFQLPIIRSTNTGISSVIYQDGSESPRLGINAIGHLDISLNLAPPKSTVYQEYGVWPFLLLFSLIYLITWWREKR